MLPSSTWKNNDVFPFGAERRRLTRLSAESGGRFIKTRGRENAAPRPTTKTAARRFFICLTRYDSTPGRVRFSSVEKNLSILLEKVEAYSEKNAL